MLNNRGKGPSDGLDHIDAMLSPKRSEHRREYGDGDVGCDGDGGDGGVKLSWQSPLTTMTCFLQNVATWDSPCRWAARFRPPAAVYIEHQSPKALYIRRLRAVDRTLRPLTPHASTHIARQLLLQSNNQTHTHTHSKAFIIAMSFDEASLPTPTALRSLNRHY